MNTLPKLVARRAKRLGRGYGGGKGGHTVGRGTKGQKSRRSIGVLFEGMKAKKSLLHRLPQLRGKLKNKPLSGKPVIVNLDSLNVYSQGDRITIESLVKKGLIDLDEAKVLGVKILNQGQIEHKLNIEVPISRSASKKVTDLGGTIA